MKKLFAILILALGTTLATAQNQGNRYMFTGKVINAPTSVPACGTLEIFMAIEFEITMFSDENYSDQTIAIVFHCPDFLGQDFFKDGATYKFEVFDDYNGNVSVTNQSVLDGYNLPQTYYAGDIKRID